MAFREQGTLPAISRRIEFRPPCAAEIQIRSNLRIDPMDRSPRDTADRLLSQSTEKESYEN